MSQLITEYPASVEARSAVAEISHLHRLLADPAIGVFLEQVAETSAELRPTVLGKLTGIYERQGGLESALGTAEALTYEYPGTSHAFNGQLKQFELYRRSGRWSDAARVMSAMSPTSETESALAASLYREYESELQAAGGSQHMNGEPRESGWGDAGLVAEAYPNPFNPRTTIQYRVSEEGHVRLALYDILGRELKVLVNGTMPSGAHTAELDGSDLPSGTYLFRLEADGTIHQGSILLLK